MPIFHVAYKLRYAPKYTPWVACARIMCTLHYAKIYIKFQKNSF